MKKLLFASVIVLLLAGCSQTGQALDDELLLELQPVNEEELEVLADQTGYFTRQEIEENYAVVALDYKVINGKNFHNLTVKHDFDWDAFMNQIEFDHGPKYLNGEGRSTYFKNGSFEQESMRFIFYSKDFSKEQLQDIFQPYELDISWQHADGEIVEEAIHIGDFFQDKR